MALKFNWTKVKRENAMREGGWEAHDGSSSWSPPSRPDTSKKRVCQPSKADLREWSAVAQDEFWARKDREGTREAAERAMRERPKATRRWRKQRGHSQARRKR
jgi:hypothetical protein